MQAAPRSVPDSVSDLSDASPASLAGPSPTLGLLLAETAAAWRNALNARLGDLNLSLSSWRTLYYLAQEPGGMTQRQLAARLGIEEPTLVRLIDRLEEASLVTRRVEACDRRCKRVCLAEGAEPMVAAINQRVEGLRRDILADERPEEIAQAMAFLARLKARFQER